MPLNPFQNAQHRDHNRFGLTYALWFIPIHIQQVR